MTMSMNYCDNIFCHQKVERKDKAVNEVFDKAID